MRKPTGYRKVRCPECDGEGYFTGGHPSLLSAMACKVCRGAGRVPQLIYTKRKDA